MPRAKKKTAAPEPSPADKAEMVMRQTLSKDQPPVDYGTGRINSAGKLSPMWQQIKRQGDCRIGSVVKTNPSSNPKATQLELYQYGQDFSVWNPCVSERLCRAHARPGSQISVGVVGTAAVPSISTGSPDCCPRLCFAGDPLALPPTWRTQVPAVQAGWCAARPRSQAGHPLCADCIWPDQGVQPWDAA